MWEFYCTFWYIMRCARSTLNTGRNIDISHFHFETQVILVYFYLGTRLVYDTSDFIPFHFFFIIIPGKNSGHFKRTRCSKKTSSVRIWLETILFELVKKESKPPIVSCTLSIGENFAIIPEDCKI